MKFFRIASLALAIAISSGLRSVAFADDAQLFMPAADPKGYFSTWSSQTGDAGRFHLAAWYNFADEAVRDGDALIISKLHTLDLVGSFTILDGLELAVDIPISHTSPRVPGVPEGFGLDDIHVFAKARILDNLQSPFGLAVIPFVDAPTGRATRLTSNGEVDFGGLAVVDFLSQNVRGSFNAGYRANGQGDDDLLFGAGLGLLLGRNVHWTNDSIHSFEMIFEAHGLTTVEDPFQATRTTPFELLGGFRFFNDSGHYVTLGVGGEPYKSLSAPRFRAFASVGFTPPPPPPPLPAPPPPPPPPPPAVVVTDEELIPLEPIFFDFDRATIKPVSKPLLDQVVAVMNDRPGLMVRCESHTDSFGSDRYNQKLSERRANSTVRYLIDHGVAPERLQAVGFGEGRPIATNETDRGRAQNRRTEFHLEP